MKKLLSLAGSSVGEGLGVGTMVLVGVGITREGAVVTVEVAEGGGVEVGVADGEDAEVCNSVEDGAGVWIGEVVGVKEAGLVEGGSEVEPELVQDTGRIKAATRIDIVIDFLIHFISFSPAQVLHYFEVILTLSWQFVNMIL